MRVNHFWVTNSTVWGPELSSKSFLLLWSESSPMCGVLKMAVFASCILFSRYQIVFQLFVEFSINAWFLIAVSSCECVLLNSQVSKQTSLEGSLSSLKRRTKVSGLVCNGSFGLLTRWVAKMLAYFQVEIFWCMIENLEFCCEVLQWDKIGAQFVKVSYKPKGFEIPLAWCCK